MTTLSEARELIATTALPAVERFMADAPAAGTGLPTFDPLKDQTLVIGSDIVSFTVGVEADFRQAIADSALFAQLAALHKVGDKADPMDFFDAYFAALMGLGWIVQSRNTSSLDTKQDGFDVHEAIIGVVTAALGPIKGALDAVLIVLNGLHKMAADAPFITLFNKRSAREKIGKFQCTGVSHDPAHGLVAQVAAFGLMADQVITQILFFKLEKHQTSLRSSVGELSIDTEALKGIKPNLAAKVQAYRNAFVADTELGPVDQG